LDNSEGRVRFRGYRSTDVEAMFQLDAVCFEPPFQFDRAMMREFAEAPGAVVILVEESEPPQLVGFLIVHLEEAHVEGTKHSYAYIVTIDVASEHRRTGIGAELLQQAEAESRCAGALQIGLHVAINNAGAVQFYESLHYSRIGVAKRFYREAQQDALVFAKDL